MATQHFFLRKDFNDLQQHVSLLRHTLSLKERDFHNSRDQGEALDDGTAHNFDETAPTERGLILTYDAMLSSCKICPEPKNANSVVLGAWIKLKNRTTKKSLWYYVRSSWKMASLLHLDGSSREKAHEISVNSPFAKTFLGKKQGEEGTVKLPGKETIYLIEKIEI